MSILLTSFYEPNWPHMWNKIFVAPQHFGGQFGRRSFLIAQLALIRDPSGVNTGVYGKAVAIVLQK